MLLKGKKEKRTPVCPCPQAGTGEVLTRAVTVWGRCLWEPKKGQGGYKVSKSYVHILQSLHSSPTRHQVDLSSSGRYGQRGEEGEHAVQGGGWGDRSKIGLL